MKRLLQGHKILANKTIGRNFDEKVAKLGLYDTIVEATSFLDPTSSLRDRLFCILHDITTKPTCKMCDKQVKIDTRHYTYCSNECGLKDPDRSNKRKQTIKQRYGVEHPWANKDVRDKIVRTVRDRYGVDNVFASEQIQQKIRRTNLERYGVAHPAQNSEVREKQKNTNLERYGVDHPLQNSLILGKCKTTNLERYGVEHPLQNQELLDKRDATTLDRYGVHNSKQLHTSSDVLDKLNDEHWLREQHHTLQMPLNQIAFNLNVDPTTVKSYMVKYNIECKMFSQSMGERQITEMLTNHNIEYTTNDRQTIAPLELDILIPKHNLAIEYCGLYWHSEQQGKDRHYHKNKHDLCKSQGIQLLTIFDDEWQQRRKSVTNKILSLCGIRDTQTVFARKCDIIEVDVDTKTRFFERNHIQGSGPGSITYGLVHAGVLVACMTFIKQPGGVYILNRYATSCNVIGGCSKLLKHFERNNDWRQIVSFADLRWSDGDMYFKVGFDLHKVIPPDYYYCPTTRTRVHKFNYRRKNLPRLLKHFDPSKSECQNCDDNGILRIWDCGKMRFIKNNESHS